MATLVTLRVCFSDRFDRRRTSQIFGVLALGGGDVSFGDFFSGT